MRIVILALAVCMFARAQTSVFPPASGGGITASAVAVPVALSNETSTIGTATGIVTIRAPFAFTLSAIRASLGTVSSSGVVTVDVKMGGVSVFSTLLTVDANEKTSTTAATAAVLSTTAITDDAELTFDITTSGTGAKGLKVWLIGTK